MRNVAAMTWIGKLPRIRTARWITKYEIGYEEYE